MELSSPKKVKIWQSPSLQQYTGRIVLRKYCLVSEKYDDQIRSAANMESQSAAASDLIGCKESCCQ